GESPAISGQRSKTHQIHEGANTFSHHCICLLFFYQINSQDDKGVLVGNWSGDYTDGVRPTAWKDSCSILRQWYKQNCTAVEYGQCWVFAAVACTVSRALGIPCRVVTNYGSAHDTNSNLLIERYYDEFAEDLDVYCCGPVPVRAIKEGDLSVKFDAPFVFAEVNADVVEYITLRDGRHVKIGGSTTEVGQCISTKAVGSDEREDITHLYKYPEGSEEERQVFEKASHQNRLIQNEEEPGVHVKIKLSSNTMVGSDFEAYAQVKNNTDAKKNCRLMFYAQAVTYNGKLGETCGLTELAEINLAPTEGGKATLQLLYSEYGKAITQDRMIKLAALLVDVETKEFYRATKTLIIGAHISTLFELPIVPLQQACQTYGLRAGPGPHFLFISPLRVGTVGPEESTIAELEFTPKATGIRKLVIDFSSDKLSNIQDFENIVIEE
uniref:Transglutaminase 2, C polypeptide A n=1 Tax=Astyanax mexicanus TaxID=7994 RepID=A0A8B9JQ84_ASTMX